MKKILMSAFTLLCTANTIHGAALPGYDFDDELAYFFDEDFTAALDAGLIVPTPPEWTPSPRTSESASPEAPALIIAPPASRSADTPGDESEDDRSITASETPGYWQPAQRKRSYSDAFEDDEDGVPHIHKDYKRAQLLDGTPHSHAAAARTYTLTCPLCPQIFYGSSDLAHRLMMHYGFCHDTDHKQEIRAHAQNNALFQDGKYTIKCPYCPHIATSSKRQSQAGNNLLKHMQLHKKQEYNDACLYVLDNRKPYVETPL